MSDLENEVNRDSRLDYHCFQCDLVLVVDVWLKKNDYIMWKPENYERMMTSSIYHKPCVDEYLETCGLDDASDLREMFYKDIDRRFKDV